MREPRLRRISRPAAAAAGRGVRAVTQSVERDYHRLLPESGCRGGWRWLSRWARTASRAAKKVDRAGQMVALFSSGPFPSSPGRDRLADATARIHPGDRRRGSRVAARGVWTVIAASAPARCADRRATRADKLKLLPSSKRWPSLGGSRAAISPSRIAGRAPTSRSPRCSPTS
jgi:hypothetical protein